MIEVSFSYFEKLSKLAEKGKRKSYAIKTQVEILPTIGMHIMHPALPMTRYGMFKVKDVHTNYKEDGSIRWIEIDLKEVT